MSRKPRVDPLVPTHAIDRRLGRIHVGTSDGDIVALIEEAIEQSKDREKYTPTIKRQTVRYALWRHHENLALYALVMRGSN